MCREEAAQLWKLEPSLRSLDVPLVAVLHEEDGAEEFKTFFQGPIYLDPERVFFGPVERRLFLLGFLRLQTYIQLYRAYKSGIPGNTEGDGTLLGGVFVIAPGDAGIALEHRERYWGDAADRERVLEAAMEYKISASAVVKRQMVKEAMDKMKSE